MKIRRMLFRTALCLATLAVSLAGGDMHEATAASSTITIGLVADVTGSASAYGVSIRNGAQLAASLINQKGGINGHPLNLMVGDGASSNDAVTNLYRQDISNSHVLALIGPTLDSEAEAADPIAQQAGMPVVATSNTDSGITALGTNIFSMSLGDADVIPLTITTAENNLHFKKVAIIYGNDNPLTIGEGAVFKAEAQKDGLDVVDTETFTTGDKDFSAQLTRIRDADPDAVLVGALVKEAALILTQGRNLGIPTSVHYIGGNGFNSPALVTGAGKAAEGAIEGAAWFPGSKRALNRTFVAQYRVRFKTEPDQFGAQAFDGVNILAAAIKLAKTTTNRSAVTTALTKIKNVPVVTGSTGKFRFTATRNAGEKGTVQIVKNRRFVIYKSLHPDQHRV